MNTADNGSYPNGIAAGVTVHYTENATGTLPRKVKTLCGQASRKSYFSVHTTAREVNCRKCLDHG